MIDRREIDAIRQKRDRLVDVLTSAKAVFKKNSCRCPFHDDRIPSAGVHELNDGTWRFTCNSCGWNNGKNSGDVFDAVQRLDGCDFPTACERLGLIDPEKAKQNGSPGSNGHAKPVKKRTESPAVERNGHGATDDTPPRAIESLDVDYEHLLRTRGIDRATAERLGIGMTGSPGSRFWTLPIAPGVIKGHRADGQDKKSWWNPAGVNSSQLWPVSLDGPGPVWLCPGELKAAAVIASGLPAIGITSGEGTQNKDTGTVTPKDLPPAAHELLKGRAVAIPPDSDPVGAAWGEHVARQALDVCTEARIVRLPGLPPKGDVGDYILDLIQHGKALDEMGAALLRQYEDSPPVPDPWGKTNIGAIWDSPKTWAPASYVRTGLAHLDARTCGGLRTRGVHAFCGKTGSAKSQLAVTLANNAAWAGTPVGFFSLELGSDEIAQLVAAQRSGVPRLKLATGNLGVTDSSALRATMADYRKKPLSILDDEHWPEGLTRDLFSSLVANGVKRFGWRLVVLDYLNLIVPDESDRDQYTTDLRNSTLLKTLARKHDIALAVVCAVRKGATKRGSEKISIDDLLGAGRTAYDAVNVFYVSRELGQQDCGIVHVYPLKMRFAPCDVSAPDVQLRWHPSTGAIVDLDYDERSDAADDDPDEDYDADEEARIYEESKGDDDGGKVPF